ncbi:MAG: hypothetical protein QOD66_1042 [Solirubrobacteraceae bacterium]|jgi:acetyl esterase/lipase|nr:hypothetical protein [Solirubrobacteraceae bacterium]
MRLSSPVTATLAIATLALAGCGGGASTSTQTPTAPPVHQSKPRAVFGRPAGGQTPRALVMLIHGGGWKGIDPIAFKDTLAVATLIQRLGYETLTVDYRQGAQGVSDVDAFYRKARRRFGPQLPICVYGTSAGGHLGLMLAVRHPDLACVIDLAGPTDLPALKANADAYRLATDAFGTARLAQFSPALHAGSIKARLMLVFAKNDPLVPVAQGYAMARADPNARLIVLPPGPAAFIHTGVGAPVQASGVDLAASQRAQQAEVAFIAAVAAGG